jgi:hypothetical protein
MQKLIELREEIDNSILIVQSFNIWLSITEQLDQQGNRKPE